MKANVPTVIICRTNDPATDWGAQGQTRAIAEAYYMQAIVQGGARPPLYRIVAQLKLDQHQFDELPSQVAH